MELHSHRTKAGARSVDNRKERNDRQAAAGAHLYPQHTHTERYTRTLAQRVHQKGKASRESVSAHHPGSQELFDTPSTICAASALPLSFPHLPLRHDSANTLSPFTQLLTRTLVRTELPLPFPSSPLFVPTATTDQDKLLPDAVKLLLLPPLSPSLSLLSSLKRTSQPLFSLS